PISPMAFAVAHSYAPPSITRRNPRKSPRSWMNSSAPRNSRLCKASRPAGVSREFVHVCQAIGSRTEFIAADTHCRVSIGASQYVPPDHQFQRDLLIQADWPVEGHFQYATRIKLLRGTEQDAFAADIQRADCRFAPPHRRIKRPQGY